MVTRVRLPVVGGLVKVLSNPTATTVVAQIANLQQATTALNAAVQTLQTPVVTPGSFSQPPTGTVKAWPTKGGSPAFMASDSAPAADPSILVQRGRRGDEGEEGRHGYSGLPGAAGAAGAAGGAGRPGREGQQGDDGRRGYPGTGAAGATGTPGAAGAAGVMGHKGDEGDEGRRGYPGTGAAGATGTPGAAGVPGRKGTDGDRGRRGYPGLGAPGATGATGAAGVNGAVGSAVIVRGATFAATSGAVTTPVNDVELIFNAACTITRVTILTDGGAGSCVIDVWKAAIGSYPPTIGGDITGGVPPSISAGTTYDNSTLSGWTTAVAAGDVILLRLASSSTFTSISIQISLTTGAAGPVVGPQGFPGRQGEPGELGRMGAQGVQGPVGNTGATGLTGPVGLGARGLQGDPGEDGRRGVPGPLGQTGLTGTTGIQGAPGVSVVREGIEGEQGRRGVQGLVGAPGAQGVPGVAAHRPYHDEPHMFGRDRVFDPRNIDGPVVMNAPASGATLTITGNAGTQALQINSGYNEVAGFNAPTASFVRWTNNGSTIGYVGSAAILVTGGAASDYAVVATNNLWLCGAAGAPMVNIATTGAVSIAQPTGTATALLVNGPVGNWTVSFLGAAGAGNSFGPVFTAGTNTADYALYVQNKAANEVWLYIRGDGQTYFGTLGTGAVQSTGGVISNVSDERAKENIRPFTRGLAAILGLNPILHGYTLESGIPQYRSDHPGFSAQNVQGVIPEAVEAGAGGMLGLSDRGILAALVNAVKELAAFVKSPTVAAIPLPPDPNPPAAPRVFAIPPPKPDALVNAVQELAAKIPSK